MIKLPANTNRRNRPAFRVAVIPVVLAAVLCTAGAAEAETGLPKIVSLDHCSDQYALALADPSQIAAVSYRAVEDYSFFQKRAQGLPSTRGSIEDILYLKPDMVIRYWGGNRRMKPYLDEAGIRIVSAHTGMKTDHVFKNVEAFSKAFHREEAGAAFIRTYKSRLKKLQQVRTNGLRAVYISAGGTTAGPGTFGDEVIKLAGFSNAVADLGVKGWRTLPLEALVLNPPDLIIGAFFDSTSVHRSNWGLLRHPVVKRMFHDVPTILVPGRLLACRAFTFVDAAEYIVEKYLAINARRSEGNKS